MSVCTSYFSPSWTFVSGFISAVAVNNGALDYVFKLSKYVIPVQLYVFIVMFYAITKIMFGIVIRKATDTFYGFKLKYFEKAPETSDFPTCQTMKSPRVIKETLTSNFISEDYTEKTPQEEEIEEIPKIEEDVKID